MTERIRQRIERSEETYRIVNGEFIDQFTTVADNRTLDEIFGRVPKCCVKPPQPPSKPSAETPLAKVRGLTPTSDAEVVPTIPLTGEEKESK